MSACNVGDLGSIPGLGRSWRRKWQPTPVLLPGKFHGLRSLVDYSPWGHKEQWVAISCSRGSSWPTDQTCIPCNTDDSLWHSLSECHSGSFPPLNLPVFEATKILSPLLNPFPHLMLWFCLNTWTHKSVFQLRSPPGLWTYSRSCLHVQLHVDVLMASGLQTRES